MMAPFATTWFAFMRRGVRVRIMIGVMVRVRVRVRTRDSVRRRTSSVHDLHRRRVRW